MTASLSPYISQFGEEFDAGKSSHYRMTIQFSLGGFSYALLDTDTNTLIALECYQSNQLDSDEELISCLGSVLESKSLDSLDAHSITCLVDNRFSTFVPQPLFNEAEQAKYLEFGFQIPANFALSSEPLSTSPCVNVFALPGLLKDLLQSKWKEFRVIHTATLFADHAMQDETPNGAFIQVRNREFDMLIKKNGKLHFFNNFKFNTKEDFAYFLLFALEQNELNGIDTPVSFTGLIRPASDIIDLCGRYVKELRFAEDPHVLQVSKALKQVPFQYYFNHYQALR